jgi:hypothetical protein
MSRRICSTLLTWFLLARVQIAEHVRLFWLVLAAHVTHLLMAVTSRIGPDRTVRGWKPL